MHPNRALQSSELDIIDAAVASLEGHAVATIDICGRARRKDSSPYRPTRELEEAMRLMNKYVTRMVKLDHAWAAVGQSGRAYIGPTACIAICKAVVE